MRISLITNGPKCVEEGGKTLDGSLVILRYLAEKSEFDCAGSNAWENAWAANYCRFHQRLVHSSYKDKYKV